MRTTRLYGRGWLSGAQRAAQKLQSGRVEQVIEALDAFDYMWPSVRHKVEEARERVDVSGAHEACELVLDYVITLEEYFVQRHNPKLWTLLKDWSKSAQDAAKLLKDPVRQAIAHRLRGRALEALNEAGTALKEYDQSSLLLADVEGPGASRARVHLHRDKARHYFVRQDLSTALDEVREGLREARDLHDAQYERAELFNIQGAILRWKYQSTRELDKALSCLERSRAISQEIGHELLDAKACGNMGLVHKDKGEYKKARECFEWTQSVYEQLGGRIIELGEYVRMAAYAYANLGTVCYDLGDYARAIKAHEDSLNLFERLENSVAEAQQHLNLAEVYIQQGVEQSTRQVDYYTQADSALEKAETIIKRLEPEMPVELHINFRRLRAELCLVQGSTTDARVWIRRAMFFIDTLKPPLQAELYVTKARIDEKGGDVANALEAWQQALYIYRDVMGNSFLSAKVERKITELSGDGVPPESPEPQDDSSSGPTNTYLFARKKHLEEELTQTVSDISEVERQYRATRSVIERNRLDQEVELLREHLDRLLGEHRDVVQQLGEDEPGLPDHLSQQLDRMEEQLKSIHDLSVETAADVTKTRQQILKQIDQAHRDTVNAILGGLDRQEAAIVAEMQKAIDKQGFSAEELDGLIDRLQMAVERVQGLSELPEVIDAKMQQSIEEFDSILHTDMNLHSKVKIAVPLFFWFVKYEAELELVDLNLKALWRELVERIRRQ